MRGRRRPRHKGIGKNRHLKRGIRDLKNRTKDIDQSKFKGILLNQRTVYETVMADEMDCDRDTSDNEGKGELCKLRSHIPLRDLLQVL